MNELFSDEMKKAGVGGPRPGSLGLLAFLP